MLWLPLPLPFFCWLFEEQLGWLSLKVYNLDLFRRLFGQTPRSIGTSEDLLTVVRTHDVHPFP